MIVYEDGKPKIEVNHAISFWRIYRERYDRPSNSDINYRLKNEYKELVAVAPRNQYLPREGETIYGGGVPWKVHEVIHDLDNNEYHVVVKPYPKEEIIRYGSNSWREPITFLFDLKEE